jgi:hypothetical protein
MAKSAAAPADAAPAGGATPPPPPPAGSKITVPPVGSYVVAKTTLKQEVEGFLYTCVVCSRDRSRSFNHPRLPHARLRRWLSASIFVAIAVAFDLLKWRLW